MGYQDAEAIILAFYRRVAPGVVIDTRRPVDRPRIFVQVRRTGGAAENRIVDRPILTTDVWGTEDGDTPDLVDLANLLRDALYGRSILIPPARGIDEVTGLYRNPDPDSGDPRYTFASRLRLRARF